MSANALIVSVLVVLAVTAATLRIATGPIVAIGGGESLYAMSKSGPARGWTAAPVELAVSDSRPVSAR